MAEDNIFAKIIRRELPADIVYEDERCLAFRDINPTAPMHVLIVPKEPLDRLANAAPDHDELLGYLMRRAAAIAADEGYGDAFRLVVNNGSGAGQTVFHLHLHVLGGRPLSWPPG